MNLALLLFLPTALAADVGSLASSTWYEVIDHPERGTIWVQLHYPARSDDDGADAAPESGPYPLVAFMHGYLGQVWMYASLCDAVASMGFVVVNLDTETHPWMDPYALADDALAALQWVEARSDEPGHWLEGMASDEPWTAMGHSMGGIALAHLVDREPRVQAVVGFAPYRDADYLWDAYADFGGAALMVGGSEDTTSTPDIVSGWFDDIDAPARGLYVSVRGAGHQAVTDIELEPATLSDAEQLASSVHLTAAFLQAERLGDERAYDSIVCSAPFPNDVARGRGSAPATAAVAIDDGVLRVSLLGAEGDIAVLYGALGPGAGTTPEGAVGLADPVELARVSLHAGVACAEVALPAALAGRAWVQAVHLRAGGPALGRVIDVFATGGAAPEPDGGGPGEVTDSGPGGGDGSAAGGAGADTGGGQTRLEPDQPSKAGGCSAVGAGRRGPAGAAAGLALLALAARLRRRTC